MKRVTNLCYLSIIFSVALLVSVCCGSVEIYGAQPERTVEKEIALQHAEQIREQQKARDLEQGRTVGVSFDPKKNKELAGSELVRSRPSAIAETPAGKKPVEPKSTDLGSEISKVDILLEAGQYQKAHKLLKVLIANNGPCPELTLRLGIVDIIQRTPQLAPIINEAVHGSKASVYAPALGFPQLAPIIIEAERRTGLQDGKNFFDQVNKIIADSGKVHGGGRVEIRITEKGVDVNEHLPDAPRGEPVKPTQIEGKSRIYVQDHPSLNHLNWNTSIGTSLHAVIRGNLGVIIRLPPGGIGEWNPTTVFGPNGTRFRSVGPLNPNSRFSGDSIGVSPHPDRDCGEDKKKKCGQTEAVYFVIAK